MIRDPTEYEVICTLQEAGIHYEDKGHYFLMKCPFHKNGMEKTPSASLYKSNWRFTCFSCSESMGFSYFYKQVTGKPWTQHRSFSLKEKITKPILLELERAQFEIIDGKIQEVYANSKALAYCRSRKLSDNFISYFNIKATDLCKFKNKVIWEDRILIPIDYEGKPYSLEGRDYTRKQKAKALYPKGCTTDIVFNQSNLNKNELLVVCEGLMDIPQIWEHIARNVTATFGINVPLKQQDFLKSCTNIVLFIDDDEAGRKSIGIFEAFMQHDFKVAVVKGKDPGDSTLEELKTAISQAVPYGEFLINESKLFETEKVTLLR